MIFLCRTVKYYFFDRHRSTPVSSKHDLIFGRFVLSKSNAYHFSMDFLRFTNVFSFVEKVFSEANTFCT